MDDEMAILMFAYHWLQTIDVESETAENYREAILDYLEEDVQDYIKRLNTIKFWNIHKADDKKESKVIHDTMYCVSYDCPRMSNCSRHVDNNNIDYKKVNSFCNFEHKNIKCGYYIRRGD